jgi:hypothetical protein
VSSQSASQSFAASCAFCSPSCPLEEALSPGTSSAPRGLTYPSHPLPCPPSSLPPACAPSSEQGAFKRRQRGWLWTQVRHSSVPLLPSSSLERSAQELLTVLPASHPLSAPLPSPTPTLPLLLPVPGITATPVEDNLRYFAVTLEGPPETPYVGGLFKLELFLPDGYPMVPPKVRFLTKVRPQQEPPALPVAWPAASCSCWLCPLCTLSLVSLVLSSACTVPDLPPQH